MKNVIFQANAIPTARCCPKTALAAFPRKRGEYASVRKNDPYVVKHKAEAKANAVATRLCAPSF